MLGTATVVDIRCASIVLQSCCDQPTLHGIQALCFVLYSSSEDVARQLVSEGALESVVGLTSHADSSDIASAASSLLLSIACNSPSLRQHLGRAGAVRYFIRCLEDLSASDGRVLHMIDALCQCCRDANNRIKIREQGGLSLLTDLLSDGRLTNIHDRIISAIVCFIYDDASMAVLLQSRLVPTLISHLYRVARIPNKSDSVGLDAFNIYESLKTDLSETADDAVEYLDSISVGSSDLQCFDNQLTCVLSTDDEFKQNDDTVRHAGFSQGFDVMDSVIQEPVPIVPSDELDAHIGHGRQGQELPAVDEAIVSEANTVDVDIKTPRYSINSPTYKAVSAWRMDSAADEDEVSADGRQSPRNIWEGARLYSDNCSASASRSRSVSPAKSPSSCSDGLCSVRSWSSSLCDFSPQKSPSVSPAWSLDSSDSGMYSPFSNTSYVYLEGACSPSSFSDTDEPQSVSFGRYEFTSNHLEAASESRRSDVVDSSTLKSHELTERGSLVGETHSVKTANEHSEQSSAHNCITESPTALQKIGHISSSHGLSCSKPVVESKSEGSAADEEDQCSDEEFDVELYQRKRRDERKFSKLFDIAQSMYASIETEPVPRSQQTKKRRRHSAASNPSPSASRHIAHCPDTSTKTEDISLEMETAGERDLSDTVSCSSAPGEVDCDAESKISDDISATCSAASQNVRRVTERNILIVLSRISHSPETVAHVMNAGTICGLFDYALLASGPLPAAGRTLLRLSRSDYGFQRAVLCLFPVQAAWRMEADWRNEILSPPDSSCKRCGTESCQCCVGVDSVDCDVSSSGVHRDSTSLNATSQVDPDSVKSPEAKQTRACELTQTLCDEILSNLSTIAASPYGQGVLSHLLLRGSRRQREKCAVSLCFLCRFLTTLSLDRLSLTFLFNDNSSSPSVH